MEVGVAGGRYSEHFLIDNAAIGPWTWYMMEPFPNRQLVRRLPVANSKQRQDGEGSWRQRLIGSNAKIVFIKQLSLDPAALSATERTFDFIYLDGAHDYVNVKKELFAYWPKVRPGGVLAGHDYCFRGDSKLPLKCRGCSDIPTCSVYTEISKSSAGKPVKNQAGVVRAVQEWLLQAEPHLRLHHTIENFTNASLAADGMSYDLTLTSTRNPSWFIVKPPLRGERGDG